MKVDVSVLHHLLKLDNEIFFYKNMCLVTDTAGEGYTVFMTEDPIEDGGSLEEFEGVLVAKPDLNKALKGLSGEISVAFTEGVLRISCGKKKRSAYATLALPPFQDVPAERNWIFPVEQETADKLSRCAKFTYRGVDRAYRPSIRSVMVKDGVCFGSDGHRGQFEWLKQYFQFDFSLDIPDGATVLALLGDEPNKPVAFKYAHGHNEFTRTCSTNGQVDFMHLLSQIEEVETVEITLNESVSKMLPIFGTLNKTGFVCLHAYFDVYMYSGVAGDYDMVGLAGTSNVGHDKGPVIVTFNSKYLKDLVDTAGYKVVVPVSGADVTFAGTIGDSIHLLMPATNVYNKALVTSAIRHMG